MMTSEPLPSKVGTMMRKMTFEELKSRTSSRQIAERFGKASSIRRKPRSSDESRLLGEMVTIRVRKAKESGELVRDGQKFRIRIK